MTTSDSENLKDNPDLGSIFEESCKAEKAKKLISESSDRDFKPYNRNGEMKLKPVSDAEHKRNLKSLKSILEIFNAEGVEPPPQIKEIRDYVDFIDNENPNDKGRDD